MIDVFKPDSSNIPCEICRGGHVIRLIDDDTAVEILERNEGKHTIQGLFLADSLGDYAFVAIKSNGVSTATYDSDSEEDAINWLMKGIK